MLLSLIFSNSLPNSVGCATTMFALYFVVCQNSPPGYLRCLYQDKHSARQGLDQDLTRKKRIDLLVFEYRNKKPSCPNPSSATSSACSSGLLDRSYQKQSVARLRAIVASQLIRLTQPVANVSAPPFHNRK